MTLRFENTFNALKDKKEIAFIPFITLCDPAYNLSLKIAEACVNSGANALALGYPFSDPCADNEYVLLSEKRALKSGAKLNDFFSLIHEIRETYPLLPISLNVYANIPATIGFDNFFERSQKSGIDSLFIPDIPVNMLKTGENFYNCAVNHDLGNILLAPANACDSTLNEIAKYAKGYINVINPDKKAFSTKMTIETLNSYNSSATVLATEIESVEDIKMAIKEGALGVITSVKIAKIIKDNLNNEEKTLQEISKYIKDMKSATAF